MKRALLALWFASALLLGFVGLASAQTDPPPTPTSASTGGGGGGSYNPPDVICPPEGTITDTSMLDPEWAQMCAVCLTDPTPTSVFSLDQTPLAITPIAYGTPIATFSLGTPVPTDWITPVGTPIPEFTNTPILPTSTSTPMPEYGFLGVEMAMFIVKPLGVWGQDETFSLSNTSSYPLAAVVSWGNNGGSSGLKKMADIHSMPGVNTWGNKSGDHSALECESNGGTYGGVAYTKEQICAIVCPTCIVLQPAAQYSFQTYHLPGVTSKSGWQCYGLPGYSYTCEVTQVNFYWRSLPTPTPTVTPTPGGVIDCTDPVYRDDTPAIEVTGTEYLGTTCPIEIPEYSITIPEFLGIGGFDYTFPGLSVCVDWYTFPAMTIFQIQFTIAVFLYPLALFVVIFIMRI